MVNQSCNYDLGCLSLMKIAFGLMNLISSLPNVFCMGDTISFYFLLCLACVLKKRNDVWLIQ